MTDRSDQKVRLNREWFTHQPVRINMKPTGKPKMPKNYDALFAEMYGIDNIETVEMSNPDAVNMPPQDVYNTNKLNPFQLASKKFSYQDSCLTDSQLAMSNLQRGKRAQSQMVFRSAMTRNPAQKFIIDELEANETREWWDQNPDLDDTLYKTYIRGLTELTGEPLQETEKTMRVHRY